MRVTLPVTLDAANRKKDRSVSLRFTTNLEVDTPDYMKLDQLAGQSGWVLFAPNTLDITDIPEGDAPSDLKKPSQRLKAVLYLLWKESDQSEEFDFYYRRQIERVIDQIKAKLN